MAFVWLAAPAASAQASPSSLQNPFFGSVTLRPATEAVLALSLDDAVRRGFETNLGLKDAEAGETSLHGEELEAAQEFLPTITVTGGTGVHEFNLAAQGFSPSVIRQFGAMFPKGLPHFSLITKADVTFGQINYNQTIFSGPAINGYKAIKAAEKVAYFSKMTARGDVVQQVATAYLAVIAASSDVDNERALLETDRVLYEQAHARHDAGTAANLDQLRAQVAWQQQQQRLIASQNQRDKTEISLKREIGIAPGAENPVNRSRALQRSARTDRRSTARRGLRQPPGLPESPGSGQGQPLRPRGAQTGAAADPQLQRQLRRHRGQRRWLSRHNDGDGDAQGAAFQGSRVARRQRRSPRATGRCRAPACRPANQNRPAGARRAHGRRRRA
uniref:Outer membrane efflux protein n=1 Tax=mine drainage metagenome TaxID=410659 RepID=E6QKV1_9ZZZZ